MKAQQIAIAAGSVYALDPAGRLRFIEREDTGLWGRWQSGAADGKTVVHGGAIVARIGTDDRVSAWQRSPRRPWFTWDFFATGLAITRSADGVPALFATDREHRVWHAWKPAPFAPWSPWEPLDGHATAMAATRIPGGGLAIFGLSDGEIHHRWQDQSHGRWQGWTGLGAPPGGAAELAVTTLEGGGGLVVFALGRDGVLYHRWQDRPFAPWQEWEAIGAEVAGFSVTRSAAGGLAVFAVDSGGGGVRYRAQPKPFGAWSAWTPLHGAARRIAAQPSFTDGLELFAIGPDEAVYHTWCDRLDWPWMPWTLLEHESSPIRSERSR